MWFAEVGQVIARMQIHSFFDTRDGVKENDTSDGIVLFNVKTT